MVATLAPINNVNWLRQRALGQPLRKHVSMKRTTSVDTIKQLQLESSLKGHLSCVNSISWNQSGSLLLSASDDCNVVLWNPFNGTQKTVVSTGHDASLFSAKFIQDTTDSIIATCSRDHKVKLINTISSSTLMECSQCHSNCVKQVITHPQEPYLIWSGGEDGQIKQYDIRLEHSCSSTSCNKPLINLKSMICSSSAGVKCLALHPLKSEMLAVGSRDPFVRMFDRRFISHQDTSTANSNPRPNLTAYFAPIHLAKQDKYFKVTNSDTMGLQNRLSFDERSLGVTHLSFNSDGSEILANFHADHIYLFDTYQPCKGYKSFESDVEPLLSCENSNQEDEAEVFSSSIHPVSPWRSLQGVKPTNLPQTFRIKFEKIQETIARGKPLNLDDFNEINIMLSKAKHCPELYNLRARALHKRSWQGDHYEAIRDCCCALALNPKDSQALFDIIMLESRWNGWTNGTSTFSRFGQYLKETCGIENDWLRTMALNVPMQLLPTIWHSPLPVQDQNVTDLTNTDPSRASAYHEIFSVARIEDIQLEKNRRRRSFDYTKRFCGHCNLMTEIKEASFFGEQDEFIVAGSDDGGVYIWDKQTGRIIKSMIGDSQVVNCVQPHPSICMLATSGVDSTIKLWSSAGKICKNMSSLERKVDQNQKFILSDPLEVMAMTLWQG